MRHSKYLVESQGVPCLTTFYKNEKFPEICFVNRPVIRLT